MKSLKIVLIPVMLMLIFGFQTDDWIVPDSAKKVKNPVEYSGDSPMIAKGIYTKHCRSCHGKNGEGDGTKSEELKTFPGDFTLDEFQDQTDGALYYKVRNGRDEMPAFDKKISEEDSWLVVHYLRSLK